MIRFGIDKLIFTMAACILPAFSYAATIESVTNFGYWYIGSTWVGGQVPGPDDDVVINGTVQALFPRTVNNITVNPGASMTVTSGAGEININGILDNQGTFNHTGASVKLYGGFRGNPTSNTLEWYAGEGVWEPSQPTSLVLRSNFITGTSSTFSSLIPNGHYVSIYARPTISIASTGGNQLTVLGDSTINITGQPAFAPLQAEQSEVFWQQGGQSYGNHTMQTLTLTDTLTPYNINIGVTITTDQLTTASGTTITSSTGAPGGYTNDLTIRANLEHYGQLDNRVNLVVNGNINGMGTYANTPFFDQRGTHRLTWDDTGDTYEYIITDSLPKLSSATPTVTTLPQTGDIRAQLTSNQSHYLIYRADGGRWSNPRTIYVDPDPIAVPDDFFSFDLITDVTLPNQVTVTVYADDPNFSGRIYLSADQGDVYPRVIDMTDGAWTGQLRFFEPYTNQKLYIRHQDKDGESNQFGVLPDTAVPETGMVSINISSASSLPLSIGTTTVVLTDNRGNQYVSTQYAAQAFDTVTFNDVVCGQYDITVQSNSHQKTTQSLQSLCGQQVNGFVKLAPTCSPSDLNPVLLVPGIMGSDVPGNIGNAYPKLPAHSPAWNSGELVIHDPVDPVTRLFFIEQNVGFGELRDNLQNQGYQLGCNLFEVPYDWTLSNTDIAQQYLKPWVEHAKTVSSKTQVDIIAHSMGGLVSRSYMQGSDYSDDVRRIAFVGTPHLGSAMVYPAWSGGDVVFADEITKETEGAARYFKVNTIGNVHAARGVGQPLCSTYQQNYGRTTPIFGEELDFSTIYTCDHERLYDFLRLHGPSAGQLMPIYDGALYGSASSSLAITEDENSFLKALNGQSCISGVCDFVFDRSLQEVKDSGVRMGVFYGSSEETVKGLEVINNTTHTPLFSLYPDGKPVSLDSATIVPGDGTVTGQSATGLGVAPYVVQQTAANHAGVIREFISNLVEFVYE